MRLDAYVATDDVAALEQLTDQTAADALEPSEDGPNFEAVLQRVVDGPWPFPPHTQLAPQPLAALDLLQYPDLATRQLARHFLRGLKDVTPATAARRTSRARVAVAPRLRNLLRAGGERGPRPRL